MAETLRGMGPTTPQALVLLPDRNTPDPKTGQLRADWSGAFKVEAERFARLHQVPPQQVIQIDISRPREGRLEQTLAAIERSPAINVLALFCHGWKGGVQLGPYSQDVRALVRALELRAYSDLAIVLYACSTGDGIDPDGPEGPAPGGEGGFADALRDALLAAGLTHAQVDAHTVVGHCCRNPFVRRFDSSSAVGGGWLVDPADPLFPRWRQRLHDTDLRHRFPLMTAEQIRAELAQ